MRPFKKVYSKQTHLKQTYVKHAVVTLALAAAGLTLSSCGKSSYAPVNTQSQTNAPGTYTVPAKMDILLAVDDTGSALNTDLRTPLLKFMSSLDSQNWDYRVAVTPLSAVTNINSVAVSKYDIRSGRYVAPYPGAIGTGSSIAVLPSQLLLPSASSSGGGEPGIETISSTLQNEALSLVSGTRFLREDAQTIVIVISTSDDTSTPSGRVDYSSGTAPEAVSQTLIDSIRQSKGYANALGTKVYSFVFTGSGSSPNPFGPYSTTTSCLGQGGNNFSGNRYMQLSLATGGKYYDICSTPVTNIFTDLNNEINNQRKNYISEYVFIDSVPELSTVVMQKISADGTTVTIPSAASNGGNGWTYVEGFSTKVPAISFPVKMNFRSGYVFKLNGNYVLRGSDRATVTYKARGLQNSQ